MTDRLTRRRTICALATASVAGLAGCSGGGSDATATPTDATAGDGDDSDGSGGTATPTPSGDGKSLTATFRSGSDTFETLVVAVSSVTFEPAESGGSSATLDAGGTTVDLATSAEETDPFLDGATLPYGTYDAVVLDAAVEEATLSDGSSATVETGEMRQSLVINDEPADVEPSRFDASLSLYPSIDGDGPYTLGVAGWRATGL